MSISIGSPFALQLNGECLDKYAIKRDEKLQWYTLEGEEQEKLSFEIGEVKIDDVVNKNVIAVPLQQEYTFREPNAVEQITVGEISDELLEKKGLLVDFKHHTMFILSDRRQLKSLAFSLSRSREIPYEIRRSHIVLGVDTDFGKKHLAIATTSTVSILKREKDDNKSDQEWLISSKSILGEFDLGETAFLKYDIDNELEFDGFLGLDLLSRHPFYIDYDKQTILILNVERN